MRSAAARSRTDGGAGRQHTRALTLAALFLSVLLFCSGFQGADFPGRFEQVAGRENGGSFDRHVSVVRRGVRLDAMVLVAPVTIRAPLAGYAGSLTLDCVAAPVFNVGDGMQMDVLLRTGGDDHLLYTRYFDAGRRAEDRAWVPLSIPLEVADASRSELVIMVSGGPQGDLIADWLALASIRLTQSAHRR